MALKTRRDNSQFRAAFEEEWAAYEASLAEHYDSRLKGVDHPHIEHLDTEPMSPGDNLPIKAGDHVTVLLVSSKKKGKKAAASDVDEGSGTWVEAKVMEMDHDSAGERTYLCYVPFGDCGKPLRRAQAFPAARVHKESTEYKPMDASPMHETGKTELKSPAAKLLQRDVNGAIDNGYDCEWPIGVVRFFFFLMSNYTPGRRTLPGRLVGGPK